MAGRFHYRKGWHFSRLKDGSVLIKKENLIKNVCEIILLIDPDSWASIVASMSAHGDTAEAFKLASELHSGVCFLKDKSKA